MKDAYIYGFSFANASELEYQNATDGQTDRIAISIGLYTDAR